MITYYEIILRLLLASIIGGLIGLEREAKNRPAGLRTHVLVTVGSALVMLISMYGFLGLGQGGTGGEPARLAAQVVSVIGFLGAGTILRQGNSIYGLTTAASLWISGCIGLAIGNGYYVGGLVTAAIVLFSLISLRFFENRIFKNKYKTLHIIAKERAGLMGDIGKLLGEYDVLIKHIKMSSFYEDEEECLHIDIAVKVPLKLETVSLFSRLILVEGMKNVQWEEEWDTPESFD